MRPVIHALLFTAASASLAAQDTRPTTSRVEFDVVSLKRHIGTDMAVNMRTSPGGTTIMTNVPLTLVLTIAAPVPLRDIIGLPDWVKTERYDITAKTPAGATGRDQQRAMWRAVFDERMKLVAHEERREKDAFALVLARADGRLGPQLARSTVDCAPAAPPAGPSRQPQLTPQDLQQRCGMATFGNTVASGSVSMDQLAFFLGDPAGGDVINRTGLEGRYAFQLTFLRQRTAGPAVETSAADDAPDLVTALQEQLGLRLQREKKMTPVFVIDHIERPSEN